MVLLLSSINDASTYDILNHLKNYDVKIITLNEGNRIRSISIDVTKENFKFTTTENDVICSNKIKLFLHRSNDFFFESDVKVSGEMFDLALLEKYLQSELRELKSYLYYLLYKINKKIISRKSSHKPFINYISINPYDPNKLIFLSIAKEFGLNIPSTYIANSKENIPNEPLITKAIGNAPMFITKKWIKIPRTERINKSNIQKSFFPSLFQEFIEKTMDIRVFYLNGYFYSAGILSQSNNRTKVDFRNYDLNNPNRIIPLKLPNEIKNKLNKMINLLGYFWCSIDLVYSNCNPPEN